MLIVSSFFIHRDPDHTYHPGSWQESHGAAGGWRVLPGWRKGTWSEAPNEIQYSQGEKRDLHLSRSDQRMMNEGP